ncbi:hypothetical protein GO730_01180 [Spirosoma sp. HMF3257]|uniref:Secretion system C-terminal sorting domain-containing protein n=1 Tax=Spirosoma telluris TaxID=2183553 RepID=A0A327NHD7_9BACT|nr:hypothetical protein [Spirosoma telluris]RAI73386.1 hypothetical protein HMF3257_01155 [Spirosoma telluris]
MNTTILSLLLAFSTNFTTFANPDLPQANKKNRPTKLAHYQVGAYLTADGTKLRVNVDKDLEGQVFLQLFDQKGKLYFDRLMDTGESIARLSLDLTDLDDGDYKLKISNGLEMEIREIKITTKQPTTLSRSITVL